MTITYSLTSDPHTIERSDGAFIPADPKNIDYQNYLEWVAAGNTAAPYVAPPAAPLQATPYQFRAALTATPAIGTGATGTLRTQVENAVAASTNQGVKDAYNYAQVFIENDPNVVALATGIGATTAEIHALFQLAQTLNP